MKEHNWILTERLFHCYYMECTGCDRVMSVENGQDINIILSTESFYSPNVKAFTSISIDCNEEVIKKVLNE